MMQAWEIQGAFGLENLQLAERPLPEPGPGQVRVRLSAFSINYRDLMMVRGHYNPRQPLPLIPGSDGCGVIDAVGDGVTRWAVGDRVCPIFAQRWFDGPPDKASLASSLGGPLDGTMCEAMVVGEEGLVAPPAHMSDAEAASLVCAAVTAWSALVTHGGVQAGDTVLVQGTGGVSMFALQIAKMAGARVMVTSSSDDKLERARALGADATLNYRQEPRWGKAARTWAGPGVDHVVEVGGSGTLEQSLRAARPGGSISVIGVLSGASSPLNIIPILMNNLRLQGIFVGSRASFEAMSRAMAAHETRPVIDRTYGFDALPEALEALSEGGHMGKIVLTM